MLCLCPFQGHKYGRQKPTEHLFLSFPTNACIFRLRNSKIKVIYTQGCALAEPGGPWRLTFALRRLGNLSFFI